MGIRFDIKMPLIIFSLYGTVHSSGDFYLNSSSDFELTMRHLSNQLDATVNLNPPQFVTFFLINVEYNIAYV